MNGGARPITEAPRTGSRSPKLGLDFPLAKCPLQGSATRQVAGRTVLRPVRRNEKYFVSLKIQVRVSLDHRASFFENSLRCDRTAISEPLFEASFPVGFGRGGRAFPEPPIALRTMGPGGKPLSDQWTGRETALRSMGLGGKVPTARSSG